MPDVSPALRIPFGSRYSGTCKWLGKSVLAGNFNQPDIRNGDAICGVCPDILGNIKTAHKGS
jgi:hypothetical protein